MSTVVTIPDFDFSAMYYADILEALTLYKRQNVPEHTDETAYDAFMQFLRMQALVGHLNNCLTDQVANEGFLPTAALAESVRAHLALIDYEMSPASPAQADIIYELATVLTVAREVVPANAQCATKRDGDTAAVYFEALTALTVQPTNVFSKVYAEEAGAFADHTTAANNQTLGNTFTPWATPAIGDALYFAHDQIMWDKLALVFDTVAAGLTGVWEYYSGDWADSAPTSVTLNGSVLEVDLTALLGTTKKEGTTVRVMLNETTAYEDVASQWDGVKNYVETGLLGQSSPSETATDYTVGTDWDEVPNLTDGSVELSADGDVEFDLPQDVDHDWILGTVNGHESYWLRYRIVDVGVVTAPVVEYGRLDTGKQYVKRLATQGRTYEDRPLGSSNGLADQSFVTTQDYYIANTMRVWVDDEEWADLLSLTSEPGAKHFRVVLGTNDRATVEFGDGSTGRIPPLGVNNVRAEYRAGGNNDGNVGANTITTDKSGLSYVNKLWNPRGATGWEEAEGASETSLERAKLAGPASLRTRDVAVSPDDVVALAQAFVDSAGAKPWGRGKVYEEGFGPKTMELVLVAKGGGLASAEQIAAIEEYLNGDPYASPPVVKRVIANQEVVAVNYTQRVIDITATVYGDVTAAEVENRLAEVLQPEAVKADGVTYEWDFGGSVPVQRIYHEIFETDDSITNVVMSTPAADINLFSRELPVLGTVSITVVTP